MTETLGIEEPANKHFSAEQVWKSRYDMGLADLEMEEVYFVSLGEKLY